MPEANKPALLSMPEAIEKFSADLHTWQELKNDLESFNACLMNFLIIGEMVLRLEQDFMDAHKEIEWHKIRGFRNLVAHDYFGIDAEEVWDIIRNKMPPLKKFITGVL